MNQTQNGPAAELVEQPPQTWVDLLGLVRVRIAKYEEPQWRYLPCLNTEEGDSAFWGSQEKGFYKLELWISSEVLKILQEDKTDILVYKKAFYSHQGGKKFSERPDIRSTGGEFEKREWKEEKWEGMNYQVYTQMFEVRHKGKSDSSRIAILENENNLYLFLCSSVGIQSYAVSVIFDEGHGKGMYATVEQVWTGAAGILGKGSSSRFGCHVLERKRGGSPALFEIMRNHYWHRRKELGDAVPHTGREQEETLNVQRLDAWDADGKPLSKEDSPERAVTLEVFSYMVSGPRSLSFGRDKWGRQIYLNWSNVIGVEIPHIRRVRQGQLCFCKTRVEDHQNYDHQDIDLVRGLDITVVPQDKAKSRLRELARGGDKSWGDWQDWFNNEEQDDATVAQNRRKITPVVAAPKRRRTLFQKPIVGVSTAFARAKEETS